MKNVLVETPTLYDDAEKRIVRVAATDLEANLTHTKDVVIEKTVERSSVPAGTKAIGQRTNSNGKITYIVPATSDDILNKEGALVSKALRNQILRLIPGDILDECRDMIKKTMHDEAAKDPDAERKKIIDGFVALGVSPVDLKAFVGQELISLNPIQLVDLRGHYSAIKNGEATWREIVESKVTPKESGPAPTTLADLTKGKK